MWNHPSVTKMYEALGAVADERVEVSKNKGRCYSSSRNKFYEITYDHESNSIMSNDNTSYWKGELGYPAVAFLLKSGVLDYRKDMGKLMKGIPWKDINQKFKNDFDKALEFVLEDMDLSEIEKIQQYTESLLRDVEKLNLKKLGKRALPPKGY